MFIPVEKDVVRPSGSRFPQSIRRAEDLTDCCQTAVIPRRRYSTRSLMSSVDNMAFLVENDQRTMRRNCGGVADLRHAASGEQATGCRNGVLIDNKQNPGQLMSRWQSCPASITTHASAVVLAPRGRVAAFIDCASQHYGNHDLRVLPIHTFRRSNSGDLATAHLDNMYCRPHRDVACRRHTASRPPYDQPLRNYLTTNIHKSSTISAFSSGVMLV